MKNDIPAGYRLLSDNEVPTREDLYQWNESDPYLINDNACMVDLPICTIRERVGQPSLQFARKEAARRDYPTHKMAISNAIGSQHTPGPWLVRTDLSNDHFTVETVSQDLRSVICRLNAVELCEEHGGSTRSHRQSGGPDMKPMMKCGHAANATTEGKPCCVICAGIVPGAYEIAEAQPDLSGRKAKCCYCSSLADSSSDLAFFAHTPDKATDNYYCGCLGWN
jgi:hypothetical protein